MELASSLVQLARAWSHEPTPDPGLLASTREAVLSVQPGDLAGVAGLVEVLLSRLGPEDRARPEAKKALFGLLDSVRRRPFLQAIRPGDAEAWAGLLVPVVERADYTFGELLRAREETDPKVVALRVLGADGCELTVAELARRTRALARGLHALLGQEPGGTVAILSENRLEAALCDLACLSNGIVDFPLPANAVADQIVYMLRHSGARVLLTSDQEQLAKVLPSLGTLPDLREIVVFDRTAADRHGLLSLDQLVGHGSGAFDDVRRAERAAAVRSRDMATAMYTSGTTGRPKAIVFSHLNIVSKRLCRGLALPGVGEGDTFLAYLPLYHTFGRWLEMTGSIWWGATYTFARSTARASLIEDFRRVRPTIFISVPKKWFELHETAEHEAPSDEPDDVARTLSAITGGRLRYGLSAAGYLDPAVFQSFHRAGVELCSGYGMTEATGGITMTPPGEYVAGSIGKALPGIELRRADDGELLIRGPYVSPGYHRPGPEDVGIDAEGWFATGDLVSVSPEGHYAITGRKKEIYKNRMGQTIAPQRVENLFRDFDAVAQAFLVGDHREYNTLLVWPAWERRPDLHERTPEELRELLSSLVASANRFLAPYERVVAFEVLPRALDVEHGELTAKASFKREVVEKNWASLIEGLYGEKHLTLPVDGMFLKIPKWVLREMNVLQHEVALTGGVLSAGGRLLRVGADPAAPGSMRIGGFAYPVSSGTLDLGALVSRPSLWLGNEGLRSFLGGEAFLSLVSQRRKSTGDLAIDHRLWMGPDRERIPRLVERVEAPEVTFLSLHAAGELLRGDRAEARRAIAHLQEALRSSYDHAELAKAMLRRAAEAPDVDVRRLALRALLPSEAPEHTIDTLRFFLDRLGPDALRDEELADLGDRTLADGQIDALFTFLCERAATTTLEPSDRRVAVAAMRLIAACSIASPRWYPEARVPLARFAHHPDEELAARGREELDRVRRGFSHFLGPNLRRALDPETDAEYGWKDVVQFDAHVSERAREILSRAIGETTLVRASVFLFGHGALVSLVDLPLGGALVSVLGEGAGKSVFRLAIETRAHDTYAFTVNLSESLHPMELRDEMDWLLAAGSEPPVVERFGGYYPEYGIFTEEYVPGLNAVQLADKLVKQGDQQRLVNLWPFLAATAFKLHVAFWNRSGRRVALAAPRPEAFLLPAHDYQGNARLVSVAGRSPCSGLDALIDRFRGSFLQPLAARHPCLDAGLGDELLLEAAVEALEPRSAEVVLEAALHGPRGELVARVLEELRKEGHTPLKVRWAARRYRRWLEASPGATIEAKGTMLRELWSTYRLGEDEKRAPDTRIRFFRATVFADARTELASELDRVQSEARTAPTADLDLLGAQLTSHRAAVRPTPEEDYFLARMTFRYLAPSDEASLVAIPLGEKQVTTVVMGLRDDAGERYFVRRPSTPREVARLLHLFHDANLAVSFTAESDALLAVDARDEVMGGLFWRWIEPGRVARMDKVVIARKHRGRGVGEGLVRELLRRLRGRGAVAVGAGFYQSEWFRRFGFRPDPTSGGIVVELGSEEEARADRA